MKLFRNIFLSSFSFLFLSTSAAPAQIGIVDKNAQKKPTLIVLGTYHMATTTTNVVNNQVDDITSSERQKQVVELVGKLRAFKPTKIALECDVTDNTRIQGFYDQYLSGSRQLSKNETNQIGFRLAKELGHKKVYCVDWGIFPDDPLYNYEKYAAIDPELNDFLKGVYDELKRDCGN